MIADLIDVKGAINIALGTTDYVEPPMYRSNRVFVFSKDFIEKDWDEFWRAWKLANDYVFEPASGMCDEFTAEAIARFMRSVRKKLPNEDITAGAFEIRVTIGDKDINGVSDGGHSTVLLAVTEDQTTITLYAWEPQDELWMPLESAIARGMRVVFIGL